MLKPTGLDRVALRASFNAKAEAADRAEFLLSDVERRLDERLDYMKLPTVARVLDLGCGLGRSLPVLARRFPDAELLALDFAELPLQARRRVSDQARRGLRGLLSRLRERERTRQPVWLAADAHQLPLAADSVDVIWSNLAFHWFDDPLAVLAECHRVLKPNGLLIFSAFGVDTCRELRAESTRMLLDRPGVPTAGQVEGEHGRVPNSGTGAGGDSHSPAPRATWPSFQDMHDWGDAMVGAGLEAPVMDAERLRLSYRTPEALAADMQALGFPHCADAFVPLLSVELVFGHAWVPVQKGQRARKARPDGLAPIHFIRRKGGKP
ncbi:MAG: methyltransferase domain-containing protein [Lautropia sp.]|nr:methyltransferase domain-containing protein [Lautropia sp.]